MLAAARKVAGEKYRIVVTAAPGIDDAFYAPYLQGEELTRDTYSLLSQAHAAVVNSGTATLETALIGCPQTAVYHVAGSKYLEKLLRPIMFKIKYFTLVNIIPGKEVIQELVASRFTEENVEHELRRLVEDENYRAQMQTEYEALWQILGDMSAAAGAAQVIVG
jgi:lipid-A-disaccharide synthase